MKIKEILKCFLRQFDAENTVDYICGTEALPLPLSPEQESEMLGKLEHGEETDKVKAELIQHNLRLVVYIARKFDNTGVDPDDLISVGTIGLIKAINSFKLDKNIKLATYASRCIENEILMYLRRTVRLKSEVSFDEPLNTDFEGNELLLSDILGTSAESVYGDLESSAEKELLKEALRKFEGTVIVVSHDRDFLTGLADKVYEFANQHIKEYLGGITDFLAAKKIACFREYEQLHKPKGNGISNDEAEREVSENKLSFEERKQLNKEIRKAEQRVERAEQRVTELESEVAALEKQMAAGVVNDELLKKYGETQKELEEAMTEWEKATEEEEEVKSKR